MPDRPNIVLCMVDQMRACSVGCYGDEVARTPNIDRLAAGGLRFDTAVTNNPVCMPARSSLLTGQYGRTCTGRTCNVAHVDTDGWSLPQTPPAERRELLDATLPELLRDAGYRTGLVGKWHVHAPPGPVGFDHAVYPFVSHRNSDQTYVMPDGSHRRVAGFGPDFEIERAAEFLDAGDARPFFLFHNISPPHPPLADAPTEYLRMHDPADVPIRPNVLADGELPIDEHWFRIYEWDSRYYMRHEPDTELEPGFDLRNVIARYYGNVTWADDTLGRLLGLLEERALRGNTLILFLSDHGDNLGSHQRYNKDCLFEESIRIPWIASGPGIRPGAANVRQIAQVIDVAPTLLELCGLDPAGSMHGRSLASILRGQREELDVNEAYVETDHDEIAVRTPTHLCGMRLSDEPKEFSLARRVGRKRPEDPCPVADERYCLYDLRDDPYELHNLAAAGGDDGGDELRRRLRRWHERTPWLTR